MLKVRLWLSIRRYKHVSYSMSIPTYITQAGGSESYLFIC